jgi:hypothetical protein
VAKGRAGAGGERVEGDGWTGGTQDSVAAWPGSAGP